MTRYVNAGAFVNGVRPKSKKALREALANDPATVLFDYTSLFDEGHGLSGLDVLPNDVALSVVGPDPYNDRRWYATVTGDAYRRWTCK